MSEKRFTVESTMVRECILDNKTGEQLDTFDYTERLCEVLNELNDENEQLRQSVNYWQKKYEEGTETLKKYPAQHQTAGNRWSRCTDSGFPAPESIFLSTALF